MRKTCVLATFVAIAIAFFPILGTRAETITMERMEMIQRSEVVFVGQVTERNARWNDRKNLIFTDYTVLVQQVLKGEVVGESVVLSFAGGRIGDTIHSVSDVPKLNVGEVSLLMVPDLKVSRMSPLTGSFQGHYSAASVVDRGVPVTFNGFDRTELIDGEPVGFSEFITLVKAEIIESLSVPPVNRKALDSSLPFVIKDLPSVPYVQGNQFIRGRNVLPAKRPLDDSESPTPPNHKKPEGATDSDQIVESAPRPRWAYENRAKNVPIAFNPWPASFPESFRSHDQFAMSYWNKYNNIFRVTAATGDWAWENGRYDMAGFETNQTMIDQFGAGWADGTLAVAWKRWGADGLSIESDIAFNPAFTWTTNDFATYFDSNVYNLDRTLTHELGHSWGLEHQFEALSVMNYSPKKYRAYNVIYRDDANGVRAAFPSTATSVTDLGVSLFYSDGYQNYTDSTIDKTQVAASDTLTVTDFIIENTGTVTAPPTIEWYLTPSIHSFTGASFIGSTTHASLNPGAAWRATETLSIPSGITDGTYYLACFTRNSDDTITENNSSWLDRVILVDAPQPPANDNWFGPSVAGFATGTNVDATVESNEPDLNPAFATVWWSYFAPEAGVLTVDTIGSDFDTILHVYSGVTSGFAEWTLEDDDDDTHGRQSEVSFAVQAGVFYDIRVAGYNSASGQIELNVAFVPHAVLLGDVNLDGVVNFLDIAPFISILSTGNLVGQADCNEDGVVNFLDIAPFIAILSGP